MVNQIIYNKIENKEIRKGLRTSSTEAEKIIWSILRNRQVRGFKFFRQYGIGRYIVDFYCPSLRLVIEIDGGQHNEKSIKLADEQRTNYLRSQNIQTLRFWNNDILTNKEEVYMYIINFITPLSPLILSGGKEQYV